MNVLIKFKKLNYIYIRKIMREKFGYHLNKFEMITGCDNFLFSGDDFLRRVGGVFSGILNLEIEVNRIVREIGEEYDFIEEETIEYEALTDRFIIAIKGEANRFYGGFIDESFGLSKEDMARYIEGDMKAILDAYKRDTTHLRIPKTFDAYSGYSKDGRLRTVVHWRDGVKTDVYLQNGDFNDLYLAIAYCYVKRKFGTMSHFKRIVERNTKHVTANVRRFIYGGDSTLLIAAAPLVDIYDQVALYLAISYLGDTDQWLTEEDIKRLEDSINE